MIVAPENPIRDALRSNGAGNVPTIFAAFGATGDLMRRKVIPAVFHLWKHGELPERFRVVGFSRRDWSDEDFRGFIKDVIEAHNSASVSRGTLEPFLQLFTVQKGTFENAASYRELKKTFDALDAEWGMCSNKLFYLSVAPEYYDPILRHLSRSGLAEPCAPNETMSGWTRIIVEKPFGMDSKTAKVIDELLGRLFQEDQIYRIDHYLAKEMMQNILTFRFSNNLFELAWGNELIENIHVKLLERIGVEDRGEFYDHVGALRDVGQNHLLQMLALVTMDAPVSFDAASIQKKRAEILRSLNVVSPKEAGTATFRAQHEGYDSIKGVASGSQTETYFKIRTELAHPKWRGVPVVLESGKRMGRALKEIVITFKHPVPCLCPVGQPHHKNEIIIRMEPREEILIEFWSKALGFSFTTEQRMFHYMLREQSAHVPYVEEYAKLLLDCIRGDQTLFISTEEVRAMWRFTDPIIEAWQKGLAPLHTYKPDSKDISEISRSIEAAPSTPVLRKEIGIIGLGKMGGGVARSLLEKGWRVHGYTSRKENADALAKEGMLVAPSFEACVAALPKPRIVWLMTTAGKAVDEVLFGKNGVVKELSKGDVVIDAGNTYFKDSIARAKKLKRHGITFIDVGFSGGPSGARNGGCLMIGGDEKAFKKLEPLFADLSIKEGYQFFAGAGAGHFVKMIHNGIEYGMMQAIGEGFAIMKKSKYKLDLTRVSDIYNHGSVIESRLVGWLKKAFEVHGEGLADVSGSVGHTGEGAWTVKTAKELKLKAKVIEEALKFRVHSAKHPDYTGKVVSALREQFGGHSVKK
ncbi:glucose-6-phosphate dehydrogenase [Candidatus Kaiserbacteria bacterium]|nr:glucose-6-phosphate dehydrogenase [Candidatus Kaiserbacteria bacterium]